MNILTFDLEEWYTYQLYPKGGTEFYLPILGRYLDEILGLLDEVETKATFFCLGTIAREYPDVIGRIAARGHEVGCHSDKHVLLTVLSPDNFKADTRAAIDSLQQITGRKVICYRAPAFSFTARTKWALEILKEEGISLDCSIFPGSHRMGGYASFGVQGPCRLHVNGEELKELPMSFHRAFGRKLIFSGGGYFRLLPYWFTQHLTRSSTYNMTYFHIRDFDKEQKRIYSKNYFHSYYGVGGAIEKLKHYLKDFRFVSVETAARSIDWANVPKVDL